MPTDCGATSPVLLIEKGPTLAVDIKFSAKGEGNPPDLSNVPTVIDTGARRNHIDSKIARMLELPVVDTKDVSTGNGKYRAEVYLAEVFIPSLNHRIYGQFLGVNLDMSHPHNVLLGRTFLQEFQMLYDGRTGKVVIS